MLLTLLHACNGTISVLRQPRAPWPSLPPSGHLCPTGAEQKRCARAGPRAPRRERCHRLRFPRSAHRAPRAALPAGSDGGGAAGPAPRLRRGTGGTCSPAPGTVPASLPARPPRPAASPVPALLGRAESPGTRSSSGAAREPPGAAPHEPARSGPAAPLQRPRVRAARPSSHRGPPAPHVGATSGGGQRGPAPSGPSAGGGRARRD